MKCVAACILSWEAVFFSVSPRSNNSPLTADPWLWLHHCLVNSFRLPMMISVTPHNEVQAWIRLGDDGGVGVVLLLSGADHIHRHSAALLCSSCLRIMSVASTQPSFMLHLVVVYRLSGPCENRAARLCVCVSVSVSVLCRGLQFWSSLGFVQHSACFLSLCWKFLFQSAALVKNQYF